jgi:hypothetical protein
MRGEKYLRGKREVARSFEPRIVRWRQASLQLREGHRRLDRAMAEIVSGEVDVFAGVEHVDRDAVTKHVHVAAIRGQRRLGCVVAKEVLALAPLEAPLTTDEERSI